MSKLTDDDLMARISRGDTMAFQELYNRHTAHLLGYAKGILGRIETAEEVCQETWVKVVRLAPSYDGKGHFVAWAYTLIRNASLNRLRGDQRLKFTDTKSNDENNESSSDFDKILDAKSNLESFEKEILLKADFAKIKTEIEKLPDEQRTALLFFVIEELSYEQIASQLGTSLSAVKSLIFRARKTLSESLSVSEPRR